MKICLCYLPIALSNTRYNFIPFNVWRSADQTEKCLQNCGYVVWDIPNSPWNLDGLQTHQDTNILTILWKYNVCKFKPLKVERTKIDENPTHMSASHPPGGGGGGGAHINVLPTHIYQLLKWSLNWISHHVTFARLNGVRPAKKYWTLRLNGTNGKIRSNPSTHVHLFGFNHSDGHLY